MSGRVGRGQCGGRGPGPTFFNCWLDLPFLTLFNLQFGISVNGVSERRVGLSVSVFFLLFFHSLFS